MLELHVYGKGLGLPSVDVKCLAAIALLQACLGTNSDTWVLIPSNDPSVSPLDELPALRDGQTWVAGYRNIADYLRDVHADRIDHKKFEISLSGLQKANCEAFLSFVESRGLPLLDLSIYVSSDNYTTVTRTELSNLLPWPQSWSVPQALRDTARKRSEHLGLSALDVDLVRVKELKKENEGIAAAIPKSLRISKKSVTSTLGNSAEQTRFRLEAVTADFFEPLQEQLRDSDFFLGSKQTVLDCLVLAILSQMSIEGLPQSWLSEALKKYKNLSDWTHANKVDTFLDRDLPWQKPTTRTWSASVASLVNYIAESIPVTLMNTPIRNQRRSPGSREKRVAEYKEKFIFYADIKHRRDILRVLLTASIGSAGIAGILIYMGVLTLTLPKRPAPIRHGFGEAGSFLGLR